LSAAAAQRELESAIRNRDSAAGVLVFDGLEDAPLGGRCYLPHGDGRFTAVLDHEDGLPLAFEVACREARLHALGTVQAEGKFEPAWVQAHCNRLCKAGEEASAMLRSLSGIERGAEEARGIYTQMRKRVPSSWTSYASALSDPLDLTGGRWRGQSLLPGVDVQLRPVA
jgi:hypothetical protein